MNRSIFISISLILLTAGCTTSADSTTPDSQPTVPPTSTITSLTLAGTPSPSPERATESPKPPEEPLSDTGPWLVFRANGELWAVNPNGSGLTHILDRSGEGSPLRVWSYNASPAGGILALVEVADGLTPNTPMLGLLSLPEGAFTPVTNLLPTDLDYGAIDPGQYEIAIDRWAAVSGGGSWSPDGGRLAYSGAQDGPSSDLYVYSLEDDVSTRLTDGLTETVGPTWSPNGERIVHDAVKRLFFDASGIGYNYAGVWSAEADGSAVDLLFASEIIGGFENILGWLTDTRYLADTLVSEYGFSCWYRGLRTVDLESGEITPVLVGQYDIRAFDPVSKTLMFGVADDALCDQALAPGLYILDVDSGFSPLRSASAEPQRMAWSRTAELFFIRTELGVLAADRLGQFVDLVVPETASGFPIVAPGSRRLAWTGDELWMGELTNSIENPPERIYSQQVSEAGWSPDGEHLLFSTNEGLYVASEPDFEPIQVSKLRVENLVWVLPRSEGD